MNVTEAVSAHDTGTSPDAIGRPLFLGLSRSKDRSHTSFRR